MPPQAFVSEPVTIIREFRQARRLFSYPERPQDPLLDCFRLEDIRPSEVMTRQGFRLNGFRQLFYDVTFFTQARLVHRVLDVSNQATNGSMHFNAPGQLQSLSVDSQSIGQLTGYTLLFRPELLQVGLDTSRFTTEFPFFSAASRAMLHLPPADVTRCRDLFEAILYEFNTQQAFKYAIIRSLLFTLLYYAKRQFANRQEPPTGRAGQLAYAYQQLVGTHMADLKTVAALADHLNVSPDYLGECTRQTLGQSPQQLLQEARLLEARSLLWQTDLSVAQIADQLGFENPANFFHFFKRLTGQTPTAFRLERLP